MWTISMIRARRCRLFHTHTRGVRNLTVWLRDMRNVLQRESIKGYFDRVMGVKGRKGVKGVG